MCDHSLWTHLLLPLPEEVRLELLFFTWRPCCGSGAETFCHFRIRSGTKISGSETGCRIRILSGSETYCRFPIRSRTKVNISDPHSKLTSSRNRSQNRIRNFCFGSTTLLDVLVFQKCFCSGRCCTCPSMPSRT